MPIPEVVQNHVGSVNEVTLGATKENGGTRTHTVTIGGAGSVVYGGLPEKAGRRPLIALDVLDTAPEDWPEGLTQSFGDVMDSPGKWAAKCIEYGADLICLVFDGIHPDKGDRDAAHAVAATQEVLKAVGVPLILWGSENPDKDNQVMPKISEAAKGENCLIGIVEQDNYKAITAVALADGHNLVTGAPLDINIGKQVNILVSDMGFPTERIVTYQSTGALGYGIEYAYSIGERQRLAALSGDKMMAMPAICNVGFEAWRAKEAKLAEAPGWGDAADRGPFWEATTAICLLQAGADIIRLRHPKSVAIVKDFIDEIW